MQFPRVNVFDPIFGSFMGEYGVSDKTTRRIPAPRDTLFIHHPDNCRNEHCTFHNPSDHHMVEWPMNIRLDRMSLVERVCQHGTGHPDPDSVAALKDKDETIGIHGCDGCCSLRERFEI